jgi:MFS family permease
MASPIGFCQWLESTRASIALHESIWVYPIVESLHVLSLCVFLGLTVLLDLRLLGASLSASPASRVIRRLMPWIIAGFVVIMATGALLFYADPVKTYLNLFFRLKLLFLVAAGLNAALFHLMASRTLPQWDRDPRPPLRARLAGGLSLALWAAIVICGRMMAYNWFDKDLASLAR